MITHKTILTSFLLMVLCSCSTYKPYYSTLYSDWRNSNPPDSTHRIISIYLAGDAGNPETNGKDPFLELLKYRTGLDTSKNKTLLFLGDNIYESGMPAEGNIMREEAEKNITVQLDAVSDFEGKVIYIPGNHDWNNGMVNGYAALLREQSFIESYLDRDSVYLPRDGCPGPVEVRAAGNVVIIILDTQWYLHGFYRPVYPDCSVQDDQDFFYELRQAVKRNEGKHILIAMHHPLYSNGNHGGYFSLKDNIFPLTLPGANNKWYIPLPVIGSLYPLLRKYGISEQDLTNPLYKEMKEGILKAVDGIKNVTFVSGHDHNLQLFKENERNFVISGSGSKINYARKGMNATYAHMASGFAKITYYDNGEAWIEYHAVNGTPGGELTFRTPLYSMDPRKTPMQEEEIAEQHYADSVKIEAAGKEYALGTIGAFFFGRHYRKEWTTPVKMEYLDLQHFAGGLDPIKKGGGQQTVSLRMMGKDHNQYNIRSINKNPEGALPIRLRSTLAEEVIKDQISTSHPYGAFTIPTMAEAAGLYHTDPELVYVPYTPLLGEYIDTFGGMMAMIEIRPDEDLSEFARFGHSKNVVSTETMLDHLMKDNDNEVDAGLYLKSRLFDMLIGDWDRHNDQWRWAEFEKKDKGSVFQPVPRDRDQVYSKFDGLLPSIVASKWVFRKFSNFGYDFGDVIGLASSGTPLDRQLLMQLTLDDWKQKANELQEELTDVVIESAIRQMPPEVFPISGPEIIEKLKSRRDKLEDAAIAYFLALNRFVDVTGSDKHEEFEVDRKASGKTELTVRKMDKEGDEKKVLFNRTFDPGITEELRLFTFEGNDRVLISGEPNDEIRIRVITGYETERINNESGKGKVIAYKSAFNDDLILEGEHIKVKSSQKDYITEYDPGAFNFNSFGPKIAIAYNRDDALLLTGGINYKTYGFHRDEFKSAHTLLANFSTGTGAFSFTYTGEFPDLFGHNLDFLIETRNFGPGYVINYFGTGNGTPNDRPIDFYRSDMNGFIQKVFLQRSSSEHFNMGIGPLFEYYFVRPGGVLAENNVITGSSTEDSFFGGEVYLDMKKTDFQSYPLNGVRWNNNIRYLNSLTGAERFVKLGSDLSVYLTPDLPFKMTLGLRFGVETNVGEFPFYYSSFISGGNNIRGFRKNRFAGNTAVFQNTELRFRLARLRTFLLNGYMGIYGFVDHGRVWAGDPEFNSSKWHRGLGPGIWVTFFNQFITAAELGFSDEGRYFYLRTGFLF